MGKQVKDKVYRYERKFLLPSHSYCEIIQHIKKLKISFSELFEERIVSSIYYDTYNFYSFNQNINGSSRRTKFRVRFYNDLEKGQDLFLEEKNKAGLLGWKNIYKIDGYKSNNINFKSIFENKNISNIPRDSILFLYDFRPVLFCTYRRKYFISSCNKIRVTLDKDLKYSNFIGKSYLKECLHSQISSNNIVLEIKHKDKDYDIPIPMMRELPLRLTKNSKYIEGLFLTGISNLI